LIGGSELQKLRLEVEQLQLKLKNSESEKEALQISLEQLKRELISAEVENAITKEAVDGFTEVEKQYIEEINTLKKQVESYETEIRNIKKQNISIESNPYDNANKRELRAKPQVISENQINGYANQWKFTNGFKLYEDFYNNFKINEDNTITDLTTEITWIKGGSEKLLTFKDASKYLNNINKKGFAGFADWRLPTLEEGISLLKVNKCRNTGFFIDPIFESQMGIWTADRVDDLNIWVIRFNIGCFGWDPNYSLYFVKPCRKGMLV